MASVDKFFYQQAADELTQGRLDQALYIKVRAENPHSDDQAAQALYLRARAAELVSEYGRDNLKRIGKIATSKANQAVSEVGEGIADISRIFFRIALALLPILIIISVWRDHSDKQSHIQALASQIEAIDQSALKDNPGSYSDALQNASDICNKLVPEMISSNSAREQEVLERCSRVSFIAFDFNKHLTEIEKKQSQDVTHFQLKTVEKL